jgi:Bacterial protein of unknown function (DUF937)
MNLVSMIMQFLAPAIINKMASSLGLNQGLAGKAIAAALPAILAGLTGAASRSGGAGLLSNVLAKQDPGLLGNFANMLGGSGQKALIDNGSSALSSLLGGSSTNAIAGAVGKFAGIDSNQSGSLLGMLAPVVMGQLAQTQKSSGLDANGLMNLLNGQKSNIAAAMPAGFSNLLEGSGVLDSIAGNLKPAAPVQHASAPDGPSLFKWLFPLAAALAAAYLLSGYLGSKAPNTVTAPAAPAAVTTAPPAAPAAPAATAVAADLSMQVAKALGSLTSSLGGIKDEASAKTALPGLQDIAKQIAGFKAATAVLPAEGKKPIASLVAAALPSITAAVEKSLGIPGVGALITPVLEPVVNNLAALAKI